MTKFSSPLSSDPKTLPLSPRETTVNNNSSTARQRNTSTPPTAHKQRRGRPTDKSHGSVMTLTENRDMNGYSDSKKDQSGNSHNGHDTNEIPLIENIANQTKLVYANVSPNENSLNRSQDTYYNNEAFHGSLEAIDGGPHREMAVDCPENFVGHVKLAPRYPPPPPNETSPRRQIGSPPRLNLSSRENLSGYRNLGDSRENLSDSSVNAYKNVKNSPSTMAKQSPPSQELLARVRKYEEDIKKRTEDDKRIQREQDFLRNSLRESQKLQSLENKQKNATGFVNNGYEPETLKINRSPVKHKELYKSKNVALGDLVDALQRIENSLDTQDDFKKDLYFLSNLFQNVRFQTAVQIHNKVIANSNFQPVCNNSYNSLLETLDSLDHSKDPAANELLQIFNCSSLQNLLKIHDKLSENADVSDVQPEPAIEEYPFKDYGEGTVKIVHLEKTGEPLGATVKNVGESVIIARVVRGGTADKSDLLHEGDEILEINGIEMKGKSVDYVSDLLTGMTGTITFMIVPNCSVYSHIPTNNNTMRVRALFNYDPKDDDYIPCRELGISFLRGDILHVIDQEDPNWWQAFRDKEDEQHLLAGLIPSKTFQEQREMQKQVVISDTRESKKGRSCICTKKSDKKKKRKGLYNTAAREEIEEILTYEEVAQYLPQPNRKRPIVLIGPPNVGRMDLRTRLMESDYERFAAAVPHTSRPQKPEEIDGKDYCFISREVFEHDINSNKFIEYGEFEKNFYGTSLDSVQTVVESGKICVLSLHPESLRILKQSDLKPYVVFIRPPNLETLRQNLNTREVTFQDNQLKDIIEKAREMEDTYGHYFDFIIVNNKLNQAYEELITEINRLEVQPQWVPLPWLDR